MISLSSSVMGESSSGRTSVLSVMEAGSGGGGLDLLETGHSPTESVRQDEKSQENLAGNSANVLAGK